MIKKRKGYYERPPVEETFASLKEEQERKKYQKKVLDWRE